MSAGKCICGAFGWVVLGVTGLSPGAECNHVGARELRTDHFFYAASSARGAVGDVVGIDLGLSYAEPEIEIGGVRPYPYALTIALCYDGRALELLEPMATSDVFEELIAMSFSYAFGGHAEPAQEDSDGVFLLGGLVRRVAVESLVDPEQPSPLLTLYFKVRGQAGQSTKIRLCDGVVAGLTCASNEISYVAPDRSEDLSTTSSRHVAGAVEILPGDPTHPEPPPVPPLARVYREAPTSESADIHFEVVGPAVTHPGAREVPFHLFVTSNYEWSGYMASATFPAEHLELARVEEHLSPGVVMVDNQRGGVGLIQGKSWRRLGEERQRVHVATLYFNVLPAARTADTVAVTLGPFDNFSNWIAVRHQAGLDEEPPIVAEVKPVRITNLLLRVEEVSARRGDVTVDERVDVWDAVSLLAYLFGGRRLRCLEAADVNADIDVDLSDAIALMNGLFRGGSLPATAVTCAPGS